jgi:hypothetical protein
MDRMVLLDDQWERIAPLVAGKAGDPGRSEANNRRVVETVLWIARVGRPVATFIPESFAGVLYDLQNPIRLPDCHRMDAPHQPKAARRLLIFSQYAANIGHG